MDSFFNKAAPKTNSAADGQIALLVATTSLLVATTSRFPERPSVPSAEAEAVDKRFRR